MAGLGIKAGLIKQLKPLTVIITLLVMGIALGLGHPLLAQSYGPTSVPVPPVTYTWTLYWNLTDARLPYGVTPTNSIAVSTYNYLINYMVPWYFTAGKSFSIYIANATDVYYWNGTQFILYSPISMNATAMTNSTGGVTWTVSTTLTGGITPSQVYANWTIVVVLNNYGGANWMVFNVTSTFMDLADLMGNLTTVSTSSYVPVSPSIAQSLIPQVTTTVTYTLPNGTQVTAYVYPLFRPVYGAETTPSDLYVILPDLYFFFLFTGASVSPSVEPVSLPSTVQLQAILTLGTGVTVFESTPNSTVTSASQYIYTVTYTGFGPIYYVTNEFSGLNPADHNYPMVTAEPVTLTVNELFPSGQTLMLFNYTTATSNYQTTPESFNVAQAYTWPSPVVSSYTVSLTALSDTTQADPDWLIGVPVIEFYIGDVYDLKANPIIESSLSVPPTIVSEPNPIVAGKLYVKWLLQTTPVATVISENYLPYYETSPALVPVGQFTGTGPSAPSFTALSVSPEVQMFFESQPVFTAQIIGASQSSPLIQFINNVYVSLMPVFINLTQYAPGVPATSQLQLSPNIASKVTVYYAYSPSVSQLIQTMPPSYATQGSVYYAQNVYVTYPTVSQLPAAFATFPPFTQSVVWGVLVTPQVNWFPAPPLSGTYNATSTSLTESVTQRQTYYYAFWVTYNGLTVGYGLFELGYEPSTTYFYNPVSGVTAPFTYQPVFDVYPISESNSTLLSFYDNSSEVGIGNFLGGAPAQITTLSVYTEVAYIAVSYTVYDVQFLNLCNETITAGIVSISELTPSGVTVTLPPVQLSSTAYIMKITAPIALEISSVSGVPYIETMSPVFNFTLNYYGYIMPSVNYTTRQPEYNYMLTPGIINVVYFPLIDINIQVLSQTTPQYPLWGFVVNIYSAVTGQKMWEAITNSSGYVYVMNVPLNASYIQPQGKAYVMLKVRTISPAIDSVYPYASVSQQYGQTYQAYASALGIPSGYYAYTLGTRGGPFDEDLVIYYEQFSVPVTTTCGQVFPITVPVENLHIVVTDLKGNVLSSQPVYPCATPSYCPSFYYNVTLVLDDQYSPYYLSSQWLVFPTYWLNLTDFRVVGQTWMQPEYEALESTFQSLIAADQAAYQSGMISLQQFVEWYVGNYSYYTLAALLANYSTSSPFAIFTFPSIVPHEGTIFVRLFMPGQAFQMKVYYLGQEVFNEIVPVPPPNENVIVTPTGKVEYTTSPVTVYIAGQAVTIPPNGTIIIETSVYPVTFNITSKSGIYPVGNTYLGLTFTDVLYREYVMPPYSALSTSIALTYINNTAYPFNVTSFGILTPSELELLTKGTYSIIETYQTTTTNYNPEAVASEEPINNIYSLAGYVLPDLMGFFVNSSSPTTSLTPLYMTSIYPNVFSTTPSAVAFNLTMGIPIYAHVVTSIIATAYPNDTFLYAAEPAYSEYRLLVNESLMEPVTPLPAVIDGSPTTLTASPLTGLYPTTYAVEVTQSESSEVNFTYYAVPNLASYRLWEAYVNATGMTSVTNATIGIYAANATGWYYVYSVNVTSTFQQAMVRTVPLYVYLNYGEITSVVQSPTEVAVVLYVYGSGTYYILPPAYYGDHTHIEYPPISSGFGGIVHHYTENLYTVATGPMAGTTQTVTFTYPTVNATWMPYFGSPLTVVIPIPSSGEAVFDIPWWAPTTGAYGTRIARFWVMGTTSTQNIGYGSITTVYTPSQYTPTAPSPLPELAISSYVLLNYITPSGGATEVFTGEIPPGVVVSNGTLYMTAIGAGTGGTSAPPMLMYDTLFPEDLWNVTMSAIQAVSGVYNIRTTALESVEAYLQNSASFPIYFTLSGFTYSNSGMQFTVSITPKVLVLEPQTSEIIEVPVQYIYGSSYEFTSTWCDLGNYTPFIPDFGLQYSVYYRPPNATFYLANGTALSFIANSSGVYIETPTETLYYSPLVNLTGLEAPLVPTTSYTINFTTLYAGSELMQLNTSVKIPQFGESARSNVYYESYYNATSSIVGADYFVHDNLPYPTYSTLASGEHVYWNIAGYVGTQTMPEILPSTSSDTEVELAFTFSYPSIPLAAIEDWDGRPLPNQVIVEYGTGTTPALCAGTAPIAIDFSGVNGHLLQPLPVGTRTVVYWYDSCLLYTITSGAYPYIDIYDTNIATDVSTLGNAFTATSVETHVVPATIYLKSATGTGIPGALVIVFDQPTMGNEFLAFNVTGTDGSITPVDYRIYPPATSQLPPTNYYLVAYYAANGTPLTWQEIQQAISSHSTLYLVPVFENTFSIQRTVTATEAIESFTLSNILTTANIVVVLSSFGPAPGVTLSYSVSEPECPVTITAISPASTIVGYTYSVTPLMPSPSVCKPVTAVTGTGTTNAQGQITTATFVTPVAPFAAQITITVQSWKGIPLGYTYTYYVTSSNATTPIQVSVPAVELTVTPVSASGAPLTTQATVNVTCAGVPIASGVGQQTVVVPIPSSGSITCTITGYSYGKTASTTVTLTSSEAGQTITRTLTIPVSGYYIPGVGFVPVSTFILLAVVIIIIIILIVILLIEYSNWRRRRLAGLLGPPK